MLLQASCGNEHEHSRPSNHPRLRLPLAADRATIAYRARSAGSDTHASHWNDGSLPSPPPHTLRGRHSRARCQKSPTLGDPLSWAMVPARAVAASTHGEPATVDFAALWYAERFNAGLCDWNMFASCETTLPVRPPRFAGNASFLCSFCVPMGGAHAR
jgi:hypothetical protein